MFIQYCLFQPQLMHFQVLYFWVPGAHQSSPSAGIKGWGITRAEHLSLPLLQELQGCRGTGPEPGLEPNQSSVLLLPGPGYTARAAGHLLTPSLSLGTRHGCLCSALLHSVITLPCLNRYKGTKSGVNFSVNASGFMKKGLGIIMLIYF